MNISSYGGGLKLWSNEKNNSSSYTSLEVSSDEDSLENVDVFDKSPSSGNLMNNGLKIPTWQNMSIQDRLLEAVAMTSPLQFARVRFGIDKCQKISQATEYEIRSKRSLPLQADGEPWGEAPCSIFIKPATQALMLKRTTENADADVANVLEWAERNNVISASQKMILLHEFSKRSEMRGNQTTLLSPTSSKSILDLTSLGGGSSKMS